MTSFSQRLLRWFDEHGRKDLPWQQARDPYRIWVSEIMLQQTQVQTVIPYFECFIKRFPDILSLAGADKDDVLQHWSGLGYYARARNLHKAAQIVRDEHDGRFPGTFDAVMALPGVGRSTAGAILSLAFDQHHAILDGNVKRVLARHEAIEGWPGTTAVAKQLWHVAAQNTPDARTAAYTQAIMDLGATLCTRSKPACNRCPVAADCTAHAKGTVTSFPGRKPKKAKPLRATTMVIARHDGQVYLERRPEAGIWGGLWSLPEVASGGVEDWCSERLGTEVTGSDSWELLRHSFSHYDLDIQPIVVRVAAPLSKVADSGDATWHRLGDRLPGGVAAPVNKLLEKLENARTIKCVMLGEGAEGLDYAPYPGDLGQRIYENVSKEAWQRWLAHQTMLINEYRLTPIEPDARKFLEAEMEKFFFGEGSAAPQEFVPPTD